MLLFNSSLWRPIQFVFFPPNYNFVLTTFGYNTKGKITFWVCHILFILRGNYYSNTPLVQILFNHLNSLILICMVCRTNIFSWSPATVTTCINKVCQWLAAGLWFSPGTPVSSTNKTNRQDTTEISLKVAINTITLTLNTCIHDDRSSLNS